MPDAEAPPLPAPLAHPRRLVFLGTPAMAVPPLRALHAAGFEVALVVTGPDRRRGRGSATSPTPVKAAALELGLTVTHDLADVPAVGADLGVVVAYGQILRRPLLEALPMINLHFSLLPRWRGAAPVERAILAGDPTTGVCVMAVEEGLDTGGVYARREVEIERAERADALGRPQVRRADAAELGALLADLGSELLVDTLAAGLGMPTPQAGETTYAAKISTEDRRIDWGRTSEEIDRLVRIGGAWTTFRGKRLRVLSLDATRGEERRTSGPGHVADACVGTADGEVVLLVVQPEGKAAMDGSAWSRGAQLGADEHLGAPLPGPAGAS